MINIQEFTGKSLKTAIFSDSLWQTRDVPITKHRALFLASNPRAEENDVVLLVAYKNGEMVGYRALFPDNIFIHEKSFKIAWGSNFWVAESYRNEGIGKSLFNKSLEAYNGHIGSLSQTESASRVYLSSDKISCISDIQGITLIYRSNLHYWIPKKFSFCRRIKPVLVAIDVLINLWANCRLHAWQKRKRNKLPDDLSIDYISEIYDSKTIEFIEKNKKKYLTQKGADELNHIIKYPTSLATPLDDHIKSRYYFSFQEKKFNYHFYRITINKDKLAGLCMLNEAGNYMKIQYYYCLEGYKEHLFRSIALHMIKQNCDMITTFDQSFIKYLAKFKFPKLYIRKRHLRYFFPSDLHLDDLNDVIVLDGDGA